MKNFKEKVIREIISLGKKNLKLRMPALVLAAVFLVIYYIVRDFFMQFTKHPVIQRVVVGILIVALLTGQIGTINAFAGTNTGIDIEETETVISGFSELPEEIREQSVPVGTAPEMLVLPDTLEAVVLIETEGPKGTASPAPTEDAEETASPTPTEDAEEAASPTPTEEAGEIVSPAPTASANEEDPEGTASPEYAECPVPTEKPEEEKDQGEMPEEIPDTEENTASKEIEDQETGEQESDEQAEDTKDMEAETVAVSLEEVYSSPSENLSIETLTLGTSEPVSEEQAEGITDAAEAETITEAIMIEGVTWTSSPEFDSKTVGEYTFTAVLPQEYVLADGVSLPQIAVTVREGNACVQISGWHFDEENVAPKGDLLCDAGIYSLVLAGGSSEVQIPFVDIVSVLPESVTVQYADLDGKADGTDDINATVTQKEEGLPILGWSCPEYAEDEEGSLPYSGSFFFRALLEEDGKEKEYAFSEGVEQVGVWVVFDTPMLLSVVTPAPGTITSDQEWEGSTLSAGTYTINPGVTVTVSGAITVNGDVTINGGGKLLRGDVGGYFNVNGENLTLEEIEVDGNGNSYQSSNSMITVTNGTLTLDGCRIHDCVKTSSDGATVNLFKSSAVFQDAVIEDCQATSYGGAVYMNEGSSLEIHGGTYQRNCTTPSSSYGGGFLYNKKSTVKIYDGRFINNTSVGRGGCIYNTGLEGTKTYLYGGCFQGNKSTYAGYKGKSGAVFYSSENSTDTIIELSGSVQFCGDENEGSGTDGVYLDLATDASRKALISSELQYPLALYLEAKENRVIAEGVEGYQLQIKDMKQISVNDVGTSGSAWYAKLDEDNNQIVLTTTNPEYDKNFYVAYVANGAVGTVRDSTAYKNGDTVTVQSGEGLTYEGHTFAGWNTKPDGTGTDYQAGSTFPITEDVTLYAKWEEAPKYKITYSGLEGATLSTKPAQHTYGTATTVGNPVKTGYIFAGWKINDGAAAVKDLTLSATEYTADITLTATWTANSYTVTYDYQGATGGNTETSTKVAYGSQYGTLPEPTRTGYTFKGWYTQTGGSGNKVINTTVMNNMNNHTLYACWKDETAPKAPALQGGAALPSGWTNTQKTIPIILSDGVGVTELWVSIDGGNYQKADGFSSGSSSYSYSVKEGQHTYQFYAKDAAGNSSTGSAVFTVRLDTAKPVIGELTYENQAANLWQWIIGKKSLLIHVPVTDEGSGVTRISYTMRPADAGGQQETKTASIKSGQATISFDKDFKGTITITCTDTAGNSADSVTINAGGGVIVEDNAPKISFSVNGGAIAENYYDAAPDILVSVVDDTDHTKSLVTGGIKSVTYEINGIQKDDGRDYTASMVTNSSFTIAAGEISTGETLITVTATDHAGNMTEESVTVKVKGREDTPDAEIDYSSEVLTGLAAGAEYTVNNAGRTADENGMISIEESWIGTTISIVKKSSTMENLDSVSQELRIPARPEAPEPALASCTDTRITLRALTGAEYRLENGTWQSDTAFSGLTPKTEYTFEAYYPATSGSFSSRTGSVVLATRSAAPDAGSAGNLVKIDYKTETFSLSEGVEAFKDAACTQPIHLNDDNSVADYIGGAIYIRYPADGDFPESEAIPVSIKSRLAVPDSVDCTDETYPNAGDGTITGLTEGTVYEISSDGGSTWTDAVLSGTEIKGLVPGSYQVRVKAGEDNFQGEASGTITIGTTQPTAETIPQAGINYGSDDLTGLVPGEKYEVSYTTQDGTAHTQECTADADGNIKLDEDWHGKTIEIVKTGNGMDKTDSSPQSLPIPARPKAPAPSVTGESGHGKNNGCVTNLTPGETYQISADGGTTWQDVTADDDGRIKNLAPGSYEVRIKDTDNAFSSESVKLQVKAYSPESSNPGSGEDDAGENSGTGGGSGTENNSGTGNISGAGNNGMIRKEVEKNENVPDTQFFMTTEELAAVVLTDAERQSVKSGTDVKILLIVEDASDIVSSQDKAAMDHEKGKYEIGQYLDISLVKIVGESREEIVKTNGMVRITISVPDELKNVSSTQTREFAVIRVHNGEAVILNDLDTDEDTVTIETDLFSSYALLYRDVLKNGSTRDNEPRTGDNIHSELYATAGMIAGFAYLLQYFGDGKCGMTEEEKKALISKIIRWAHRGGKFRRNLALAAVFLLLVYYHSIGKKVAVKWNEVYGA